MKSNWVFGVVLAGAFAFTSAPAEASESKAKRAFGNALSACKAFKRFIDSGKTPVERDYQKWLTGIPVAKSVESVWNAEKIWSYKNPKAMAEECQKIMDAYANGSLEVKGVAIKDMPLSKTCNRNVGNRLGAIFDKYSKQKEKGDRRFKVWFARQDVEAARYYIYGDKGLVVGGATCDTPEKHKAAMKPMIEKLKKAEKMVSSWEAEKNVKWEFKDEKRKNIQYRDASGKIVSGV